MRVRVIESPLDLTDCALAVQSTGNGALVLFVGTVRDVNDGRKVTGIEYSAYASMATGELGRIVREAADRFGTDDIAVDHRVGVLDVGEASVIIAAAHPHRASAFDACRYVIEELKRRVPIWKCEHYADGSRDWVDPTLVSREV